MALPRKHTLLVLLILVGPGKAEEAVKHDGTRLPGVLHKTFFQPANAGPRLSFAGLHSVRFTRPLLLPIRARLSHHLLLAGEQRLSGELVRVTEQAVEFRGVFGNVLSVPRAQCMGIVQAGDDLVQIDESFEGSSPALQSSLKPQRTDAKALSGEKSLLIDAAHPELALRIPPQRHGAAGHRVTLYFHDPAEKAGARCNLTFVFQVKDKTFPLSVPLKPGPIFPANAPGWHVLQVEWSEGVVRSYVDDHLLGSQDIDEQMVLTAIRFGYQGAGNILFDALSVAEKVAPLSRSAGPGKMDEVWLASGDQLFGKLVRADAQGLELQSPLGKQVVPWPKVRGIFFSAEAPGPPPGIDVHFRAGPGLPPDRLTGELVELNEQRLLLRHARLGDVSLERSSVHSVYFRKIRKE